MPTPSTTLINLLEAAAQMLASKEETYLNHQTGPGRWSPKQVIGHLIDSAYNNHRRFLMAQHQDHLRFEGYEQVDWVDKNRYQDRDVREVVSTFLAVQNHLAEMLKSLPKELLDRQTTEHDFDQMAMRKVKAGTPSSLGFLIEDYLFHIVHHLRQIDADFDFEWQLGYQDTAVDFRLS